MSNYKETNILAWLSVIFLSIILSPVAIMSYAYCTSCIYYWYMPYILASFPMLKFSSFIAFNSIIGMAAMPYFVHNIFELQKKVNKTAVTPSTLIFELLSKILIMPWVILLVGFIMFKIITCFIHPVVA